MYGPTYMPRKPRFYKVQFSGRSRTLPFDGLTLTYHSFHKLRKGEIVTPADGLLVGEVAVVRGKAKARKGYSYGIERVKV